MKGERVAVVGGGAAGVFAALACAEAQPELEVVILEQSGQCLGKVLISGGGRCNVTRACFDPGDLASGYPRGGPALRAPFQRFQPRDTEAWFASRGVRLKTEPDGRMFPVTDSSQTIVDCFLREARERAVRIRTRTAVAQVRRRAESGFELALSDGSALACDRLLLATGGCRGPAAAALAASLGHRLEPPVPSLFTFQIETPWVRDLAGVAVGNVEAAAPAARLRERGPVLFTHWGLSGPAILRLSAWGARKLHSLDYRFALLLNWLPERPVEAIALELESRRQTQPAKRIAHTPVSPLPARLWEAVVRNAGIAADRPWAGASRAELHRLLQQLIRTELPVTGKSLNKDEFVTCGGVRLAEVDFKTMASRVCPGLFLAGELLDVDGLTGGYNLQAAWTTGWIAGHSLAGAPEIRA